MYVYIDIHTHRNKVYHGEDVSLAEHGGQMRGSLVEGCV